MSGYLYAPANACPRCEGCKQIASGDEGEPWYVWAELPPPSNLAVVMGVVKPLPCPECGGTGVKKEATGDRNQ